jgi:hypothetical protein
MGSGRLAVMVEFPRKATGRSPFRGRAPEARTGGGVLGSSGRMDREPGGRTSGGPRGKNGEVGSSPSASSRPDPSRAGGDHVWAALPEGGNDPQDLGPHRERTHLQGRGGGFECFPMVEAGGVEPPPTRIHRIAASRLSLTVLPRVSVLCPWSRWEMRKRSNRRPAPRRIAAEASGPRACPPSS